MWLTWGALIHNDTPVIWTRPDQYFLFQLISWLFSQSISFFWSIKCQKMVKMSHWVFAKTQNLNLNQWNNMICCWPQLSHCYNTTVGRQSAASGSVMCAIDPLTFSCEDVLFTLPPPVCTSHDSRVGAKTVTSDPDEAHKDVWWCAENVCRGFWRFTGLSDTGSDTGCGGLNSAWGSQSRATTERKSRDGLTPNTHKHTPVWKGKRANVKTDVMFLV